MPETNPPEQTGGVGGGGAEIASARAYIDALVSHDASEVPLAADAVRYEVGVKTGRSGDHIRRSLERGPQFRVVAGVRDLTATREGDTVRTRYLIDTVLFGLHPVVAEVSEDFRVGSDGLVHRIDARIRPRLGPMFDGLRRGRSR